jgi:hypothetical protein
MNTFFGGVWEQVKMTLIEVPPAERVAADLGRRGHGERSPDLAQWSKDRRRILAGVEYGRQ